MYCLNAVLGFGRNRREYEALHTMAAPVRTIQVNQSDSSHSTSTQNFRGGGCECR